jgi:lantibiotic biosynthesis protein
LQQLQIALENLDKAVVNTIDAYDAIKKLLKAGNIHFDETKLFQTDLFFNTSVAKVNISHQQQLQEAYELLYTLFASTGKDSLQDFAERFVKRYEDATMPLLQVLDAESGIGYITQQAKVQTPLLDDLPYGNNNSNTNITLSPVDDWLFKKLLEAHQQGLYEVNLTKKDITSFTQENIPCPPSASVMFKLLQENNILLEGISGSSAANLLARFAYGHTGIQDMVQDIVNIEEQHTDYLFAEIIHLPENRTGNILLHPPFRKYEIAFLAKPSVGVEYTIPLQDIELSVTNGIIQLHSRTHQKIIIPRLSSAHNFSYNALPVYHFLCDLQAQQHCNGLFFSWGSLSYKFSFLPRVVFKNIILHEATWHITKQDIEEISKMSYTEFLTYCKKVKLPNQFVIADGDNELLINTESTAAWQVFITAIQHKTFVTLKEFLAPSNCVSYNNQYHSNQFIAPILFNTRTTVQQPIATFSSAVQQTFMPGTNWVYYKIYCGHNDAEIALAHLYENFIQPHIAKGYIQKWFFIRYTDPDFHIRLRFLVNDVAQLGSIYAAMLVCTNYLHTHNIIWRVQLDTYVRELKRYMGNMIEPVETIFCVDAILTMHFIQSEAPSNREVARALFTIRKINFLLKTCGINLQQQQELFAMLATSYNTEQHIKNAGIKVINKKFAQMQQAIHKVIANENVDILYNTIPNEIANKYIAAIEIISNSLQKEALFTLLTSIIHMLANRMYSFNPRVHETVIYNLLNKFYTMQQHKLANIPNNVNV